MKFTAAEQQVIKEVRTYSDNDKQRFIEKSKEIISEHISKYSHQTQGEIKNVTIHLATFE